MRVISGNIERELAIFVEDTFARQWIEGIIRSSHPARGDNIGVFNVGGDTKAVSTHVSHLSNPAMSTPSICYLDGDALPVGDPHGGIFKLPGQAPETYIYDAVLDKIDELQARLAIALQLDSSDQKALPSLIRQIRSTNRDHHLLFQQVGDQLGFLSENIVAGAFISTWIYAYPDEAKAIYDPINEALKRNFLS